MTSRIAAALALGGITLAIGAFAPHSAQSDAYTDAAFKALKCEDRACLMRAQAEMQAADIMAIRKRRLADGMAFCDYKGKTAGADAKTACLEYVKKTGKSPGE